MLFVHYTFIRLDSHTIVPHYNRRREAKLRRRYHSAHIRNIEYDKKLYVGVTLGQKVGVRFPSFPFSLYLSLFFPSPPRGDPQM